MKNRFTTRYIVIAALFITILAPMTRVHANGALDNTFGNNDPKNGIYTLAGSLSDGAIFYDLAAQGNKSIIVGAKENDLIVVRLNSSGELDPTFGTAGSFLYDTSSLTSYSADNVAVDSVSGSIYVLGTKGSFDLFVLKLTSAGALDPDFGVGGVLSITAASVDTSYALTPSKIMLYQDSLYVAAARTKFNGSVYQDKFYVAKINPSSGMKDNIYENPLIALNSSITGTLKGMDISGETIYLVGNFWNANEEAAILMLSPTTGGVIAGPCAFTPTSTKLAGTRANWSIAATDVYVNSGDIFTVGYIFDNLTSRGNDNRAETFIHKFIGGVCSEESISTTIRITGSDRNFNNNPDLVRQSDGKYVVLTQHLENTDPVNYPNYWKPTSFLLRYNSELTLDDSFDGDGIYYLYELPPLQNLKRLLIQDDQKLLIAGGYGDLTHPDPSISPINGYFVSRHRTATSPSAPTIGTATTASATSATVTFTAPASNGGSAITSYTATSSPGGLTGTLAGATAGTITISGLTASTAYTFTVTATNSEGTSTASSASNSITTSAIAPESGGSGPVSTAAADELRRQQDAAAAEKQRKDRELTETLALVPVIAGLAQELAGLGDSILKPKKCVKGKSVKRVSSTAKCPKGFKVKR
jgi:uncharacterized delta-60 repeat protein